MRLTNRMITTSFFSIVPSALSLALLVSALPVHGAETDPSRQANSILEATGIQGGVVVHLGCGDGRLTAALCANERYLVHGLDRDPAVINEARDYIRARSLYGRVSVNSYSGQRLPYTDNLINLLVVEDPAEVTDEEIRRVLCPGGVAYVREGNAWKKSQRLWPNEIDEWTHYLHGPDNNAVAKDQVVGPPHHVQWIGGPKWARGHEVLATISTVVSAGGRLFYIADEGVIASVDLPSRWVLVARDAFNGKILWKRNIPQWESRHRPFRSGPTHLPRRLIAIEDRVYVTLGFGEPVVALNAATGEIEKTYEDSAGTEEILFDDGKLFLVAGDPQDQRIADQAVRRGEPIPRVDKTLMAVQADSGELLWEKSDNDLADLFAQTLAVSDGKVFLQNTRAVICLDAESGNSLWRASRPASLKRPAWSVPTLVVHGDVVLSADREAPAEVANPEQPQSVEWTVSFQGGNSPPGELIAFSVETGEQLWRVKCREGYNAPVDVLLADGLLWTGDLVRARDPGITEARDPLSGDVKRERPNDQVFFTPGMSHHRCYRNRATDRFILLGRSGVELVDVKSGKAVANHWIRGTCQFGVLPANGLIYVPPHTCACYLKTKLHGFNALAPRRETDVDAQHRQQQLVRGAAYAEVAAAGGSTSASSEDWPTYRHDAARSSAVATQVPAQLKQAWNVEVGGQLSSVVVAEDTLLVAEIDGHRVHALDAASGEPRWTFTAGGRVDSPPTIYRGVALFGSVDGWVYCLRIDNGELVWQFRAGPEDRLVAADGGLESAWPIHGSVLVEKGVAYFVAGRSSFLDGGIYMYGLDPMTGSVVEKSRLSGRDPVTGEQPKEIVEGFDMPGGLPDVLSSDGQYIYMRDLVFNDHCEQQDAKPDHLFSPTGFLDDSWWHRSYFIFGPHFTSGWGGWHRAGNEVPAGRLLVFDDNSIYGFGRNEYPQGNAGQWQTGEYYRLFAASKQLKEPAEDVTVQGKRRRSYPKSRVSFQWSHEVEPEVRAMVLADKTVFIAGPHGEAHKSQEAFEGDEGISLQAISTSDGARLASYELSSLPVFDGMAAAQSRVYLALKNGNVVCFAGSQ